MLASILLLTACKESKSKIESQIKEDQSVLYGDGKSFNFDKTKAEALIASYDKYITAFPQDEKTPSYIFNQSEVYATLKDYDKSIACYQKVYNDYKDSDKAATCLFMLGFTYEDKIKDLNKAKTYYEEFLAKFPNHELADDVQFSLSNLGKSPEEIMKQFEEKLKSDHTGDSLVTEVKGVSNTGDKQEKLKDSPAKPAMPNKPNTELKSD